MKPLDRLSLDGRHANWLLVYVSTRNGDRRVRHGLLRSRTDWTVSFVLANSSSNRFALAVGVADVARHARPSAVVVRPRFVLVLYATVTCGGQLYRAGRSINKPSR